VKVSIVIVARNEERYLGKCLESLQSQLYPHNLLEVMLVNSASTDRTLQIMEDFSRNSDIAAKIYENPNGDTPGGMNIGINNTTGDAIMLMTAHGLMPSNHIERQVRILKEKNADGVSSRIISIGSGKGTVWDNAVSAAMESRLGIGNATARTGGESRWINNPMFALYRKKLFDKFGLIDSKLTRNQDYEFNQRCFKSGAKFWFQHDLYIYYHNRANLKGLFRQYFNSAKWRVFMIGKFAGATKLRHLVPPLFVIALLAGLLLTPVFSWGIWTLAVVIIPYALMLFVSSFQESIRRKKNLFHILPLVLSTIHFAFGLGFISGFLKFFLFGGRKKVKKAVKQ